MSIMYYYCYSVYNWIRRNISMCTYYYCKLQQWSLLFSTNAKPAIKHIYRWLRSICRSMDRSTGTDRGYSGAHRQHLRRVVFLFSSRQPVLLHRPTATTPFS